MIRDAEDIIISVSCITFNHVNYIRDAIEGFLMQKTTFPFEILIHDDASNDGTAEIIREYEKKYPNLIFAIYQTENQYSKGVRAISAKFNYPRARGKYFALCEGDDHWTDPLKLQKQVDFLEANPEYVVSYHDAIAVDEKGNSIAQSVIPDRFKRDFSQEDLILKNAFIMTLTAVCRNILLENSPERAMVINGDTFLFSILGLHGKGKYHSDIKPAVHRVHPGGIWSMKPQEYKIESQLKTIFCMYSYYNRIGKLEYATHHWKRFMKIAIKRLSKRELIWEFIKRLFYLGQIKRAIKRKLFKKK